MKNFNTLLFSFLAIILFNNNLFAQNYNLLWANRTGNNLSDAARVIDRDNAGNLYIGGNFSGTVDFDPGSTIYNMTSSAGQYDAYILKLSPDGNFIWAKQFNINVANPEDGFNSIRVSNDGVLLTGAFVNTTDFNPGTAVYNLTMSGSSFYDGFLAKLDLNGNFVWAQKIGSSSIDCGRSIALDAAGNILLAGYFGATVDFDNSSGIANLTAVNNADGFLLKLNALGAFQWVKRFGGNNSDDMNGVVIDNAGNIILSGSFASSTFDADPDISVFNLNTVGIQDIAVIKLTSNGNFIWAKSWGTTSEDRAVMTYNPISDQILLASMNFSGSIDIDPDTTVLTLTSAGGKDIYITSLYNNNGSLAWAGSFGGPMDDEINCCVAHGLKVDGNGNIYMTGGFRSNADLNPGAGSYTLSSAGNRDIFLTVLDQNGVFQHAVQMGGTGDDKGEDLVIDNNGDLSLTGYFQGTVDFDPGVGTYNLNSQGSYDFFSLKFAQNGISGRVYQDLNQDCLIGNFENGLGGRSLIIQPGNIIVQTNNSGIWHVPTLPAGSYNITVDTTGSWISTCTTTQNFTYSGNGIHYAPNFGFYSAFPCATSSVSIHMPFIRRGFSNQRVFAQACNQDISSRILNNAFAVVELDQNLLVQAASNTYTSLGSNRFQVNLGNLAPGQCTDFWFDCQVSMNTVWGQTLCMNVELFPIDSCSLDTTPVPFMLGTVSPCNTPWDKSSLRVEGSCVNDSVRFVIYNTGSSGNGNMTCVAPVRLYIDGQYVMLDSIQLTGGDSAVFMFPGDGRTWRLEADQHPLHPGLSHPNAVVELCGNAANWTPNLVNAMPLDDIDPAIDIFCGIATGSYDPNDKTGFPLGLGTTHNILPNQEVEYLIRFQNTGNDTAFTIVIRDTLQSDFDIFSVRSGVSSDNYDFRMYGPRVLEWTFNNIMLPDSNVNEPESHGFIKFTVRQNRDLPIGTLLENSAAIYFDFNPPIITNTYFHTIDTPRPAAQIVRQIISTAACNNYSFHGYTYAAPGNYFVPVSNNGIDSLYILQLSDLSSEHIINSVACGSYSLNGQNYTSSGTYTQSLTNAVGCDSTITLNLTILNSNALVLNETACDSYTLNGQNYTASGTYTVTIANSVGCDSVITLNLNINNSSNSTIDDTGCGSYSLNGMIYTSSDTYTQILTNTAGCDSIITLKVAIFNTSNTVLTASACTEYTLNGRTYTSSGTYNQMFTNAFGCDSLVTLQLTLVDTSISINNNILTANAQNAAYQWLDCDNGFAPISGANSQTFEPTANGSYAVIITNGTCTEQSACYNYTTLAVTAQGLSEIRIYPNPTTGKLNLDFGNLQQVSTQLIDLNGRLLMQLFFENQNGQIDMTELPAGMYFLRISSRTETLILPLTKS